MSSLYELRLGDCVESMKQMPAESVDSIVTDPPGGIDIVGEEWDCFRRANNPNDVGRDNLFGRLSRTSPHSYGESERAAFVEFMIQVSKECLRVLKPGGHGFFWAMPRTSHWTGWALEDGGFEIRDSFQHIFGQGAGKGLSVGKALKGEDGAEQWEGWRTTVRPAHEVWWLVRKPLSESTVAEQVLKTGTGALNIDSCRTPYVTVGSGNLALNPHLRSHINGGNGGKVLTHEEGRRVVVPPPLGRYPTNLLLSHSPDCSISECVPYCPVFILDQQSGERKAGSSVTGEEPSSPTMNMYGEYERRPWASYGDTGGASRFFPTFRFCSKASPRERTCDGRVDNTHPTIKPLSLCKFLCRLVTPPGGTVLDAFCGSGSIGMAAVTEGFKYIWLDKNQGFLDIARQRIEIALDPTTTYEPDESMDGAPPKPVSASIFSRLRKSP